MEISVFRCFIFLGRMHIPQRSTMPHLQAASRLVKNLRAGLAHIARFCSALARPMRKETGCEITPAAQQAPGGMRSAYVSQVMIDQSVMCGRRCQCIIEAPIREWRGVARSGPPLLRRQRRRARGRLSVFYFRRPKSNTNRRPKPRVFVSPPL